MFIFSASNFQKKDKVFSMLKIKVQIIGLIFTNVWIRLW